ncbi:MAG: ABC transporter substrate-binding protein [Betaproteobacteria bacterium]|nr:ABC transporter substrate-binding protein [Betaproteobacteria bacterium]
MRGRCGLVLLLAGLTAGVADAQPAAKLPRIGWLTLTGMSASRQEAFPQGLRGLGYIDGQNIIIEHRIAGGQVEHLPALAAELVELKVDVLVALEPPAVRAAKNATKTIPIVMRSTDDPVELGWVASLARPGGNITGVTSYARLLTGKRMELLLEAMPKLSRVAVLWNPAGSNAERNFGQVQAAARALRVQLLSLEVRSANDFERAFETAVKEHAGALITIRTPLLVINRGRIAELAAKSKLPAIYDDREFVEAGGLMSYGAHLAESYRRAAFYVDKILKGANPAELPVEQPTRFELWVNLKTAGQIGFTLPPEVLLRADKVLR